MSQEQSTFRGLKKKPRYSKRARFWLSFVATAAQVAVVIAVGFWVLPGFDIHLPWAAIAGICVLMVAWDVFTYVMGNRALDCDVVRDLETMVGQTGTAVTELKPDGHVRLRGELWAARSTDGLIARGTPVEVVTQEGLKLEVRLRPK